MAGEANIWNPRTLLQLSADTKRIEEKLTAVAGQTLFTLKDFTYVVDTGSLAVYLLTAADVALGVKGARLLKEGVEWAEGTISTFSITVALAAGDQIYAVGYVAITGLVDVRDTDIFVSNYQAIRDYVGTEVTLYSQGQITKGDEGEAFFQEITGQAPGFFVDNNLDVIVPTGGDGSRGWIRGTKDLDSRMDRLNPDTLAIWQADTSSEVGDVVTTKERTAGAGGGAAGKVIAGTGTANGFTIVAHSTLSQSWVLNFGRILKSQQLGAIGNGVANDFSVLEFMYNSVIKSANTTPGLESSQINQIELEFESGRTYRSNAPLFLGSETTDPDWIFNLKIRGKGAVIEGNSATATDHTLTIAKASKLKYTGPIIRGKTCKGLKLNTIEHSYFEDLSPTSDVSTGLTVRGFLYNTNFKTTRIGGTTGFAAGAVADPALDADFTAEPLLISAFRGARIVEFDGLYITGMGKPILWKGDPSLDPADALSGIVKFTNIDWELNNSATVASFENVTHFEFDNLWNEGASFAGLNSVLHLINTKHCTISNIRSGARYHKLQLENTDFTTVDQVEGGGLVLTATNNHLITSQHTPELNSTRELFKNLISGSSPFYTDLKNFEMTHMAPVSISTGLELSTITKIKSVAFIDNKNVKDPTGQTFITVLRFTTPVPGTGVSPLGFDVTETTVTSSGGSQTLLFQLDTALIKAKNEKVTLIFAVKHVKKVGTGAILAAGSLANGQFINGAEDFVIYKGDWAIFAQRLVIDSTVTGLEIIFNDSVALTTNDVLELGGAIVYAGHDVFIPEG